jgi:hypothetical protein
MYFSFLFFGSATPCAFPPPWPYIFSDYSFWSTALLTGMTGISLHMQWPLTSQSHGSVSKRKISFFVTDQTPCPFKCIFQAGQQTSLAYVCFQQHCIAYKHMRTYMQCLLSRVDIFVHTYVRIQNPNSRVGIRTHTLLFLRRMPRRGLDPYIFVDLLIFQS